LRADGAEVVVIPEKLAAVSTEEFHAVTRVFSDAARSAHVRAIAGLDLRGSPWRNVALVFTPTAAVTG
jgi:hypothetical protein